MAKGASYNESYLSLGTHTGTHIDAPFHALADGQTLDQISLEQFIGSAQVLKIPDDVSCITADILQTCDIKDGIHALLFKNIQFTLVERRSVPVPRGLCSVGFQRSGIPDHKTYSTGGY